MPGNIIILLKNPVSVTLTYDLTRNVERRLASRCRW